MSFIKNLSKREKLTLVVALAVLIGVLYYIKFFEPARAEIRQLNEKTDTLRSQYTQVMMMIRRKLPQVKQSTADLQNQYKTMVTSFPSEGQVSQLLLQFEQMANEQGITMEYFSPKPMVEHGDFYELPLNVSFKSTYHEMVAFLLSLENSDKRMDVIGFDVRRSEDLTKLELQVDLNLNVYIIKG